MKGREKKGKEQSIVHAWQVQFQQARIKEGSNILGFIKYSGNLFQI